MLLQHISTLMTVVVPVMEAGKMLNSCKHLISPSPQIPLLPESLGKLLIKMPASTKTLPVHATSQSVEMVLFNLNLTIR